MSDNTCEYCAWERSKLYDELENLKAENEKFKLAPIWTPVSEHGEYFTDGDQYLVALMVNNKWEFHMIQVSCDSESPVEFYKADDFGDLEIFDDWEWDTLEYYIKL